MKEYDLNVSASQIITVKAETEEEAFDKAFHESFGRNKDCFATYGYEVVGVIDI